jgi:hypothetical protein
MAFCGFSAAKSAPTRTRPRLRRAILEGMKTSYAVKWREPDGKTYVGRLEFGPQALVLEGRENGSPPIRRTLGYDTLGGFHLARSGAERLDGQLALVVECGGEEFLITSTVIHAGVLQELVHRLSELRLTATRRATVVVPLKDGMYERALALAAKGPPFDPVDTLLVRHQLLLTPAEAIFVFEADSELALEALLGELDVWAAAAAWGPIVGGPPRLAEVVYAWERPPAINGVGLGY